MRLDWTTFLSLLDLEAGYGTNTIDRRQWTKTRILSLTNQEQRFVRHCHA